MLQSFVTLTTLFLPMIATMLIAAGLLWGLHWLLIARQPDLGNERLFPRQLAMLGLSLAALIAVALSLPVDESSRNQIIGLIGLVISGVFAFSSSTIFANLMAGIMLRMTKPFRTGDFIKVDDYFGRVVERGLLDTELQTETRELVALPNTFLITHPVTVTRSSGTIISTTLSLGYDIHNSQVELLLLEAASECGLSDPFVHILELGDFAITYRVSGMLVDVKSLLTVRSNLSRFVLNTLHGNSVEIVSPGFMNQRRLADDAKMIPPKDKPVTTEALATAEEVIFDKAEQAEQTETEKQLLLDSIEQHKSAQKAATTAEEKQQIEDLIKQSREQLKSFKNPEIETASDQPANNK